MNVFELQRSLGASESFQTAVSLCSAGTGGGATHLSPEGYNQECYNQDQKSRTSVGWTLHTFAWVENDRSSPLLVPLAGDAKSGVERSVISLERLSESLALVAEGNE